MSVNVGIEVGRLAGEEDETELSDGGVALQPAAGVAGDGEDDRRLEDDVVGVVIEDAIEVAVFQAAYQSSAKRLKRSSVIVQTLFGDQLVPRGADADFGG